MIKFIDHKEVFEQLFRENYVRLYYHALSFLNDEKTAKDTVNDVFEKVWMNFEKIERSPISSTVIVYFGTVIIA